MPVPKFMPCIQYFWRHFTQNHKCEANDGATRKVRASPKWLGFIIWGPWMWWIDRRTNIAIPTVTLLPWLITISTELFISCQNCTTASSNHLPGSCLYQWQNSYPNRFMICMGGPVGNWTSNPTMRHRIDTEYTVRYTQYITPWPLTHPRCAVAFFNFSIARDRRQRNEVFQKALRHLTSVADIWISLDCYACNSLKVEQVGLTIVIEISVKCFPDWFPGKSCPHTTCTEMFGLTVTQSFSCFGLRVKRCPSGLTTRSARVNMIHTHAEMNTIIC